MHQAGEQHFYETRQKQEHAHIICLSCGKVEEYFGDPLKKLRREIESTFGFQILLTRTEVGGYCSHCQARRAQGDGTGGSWQGLVVERSLRSRHVRRHRVLVPGKVFVEPVELPLHALDKVFWLAGARQVVIFAREENDLWM